MNKACAAEEVLQGQSCTETQKLTKEFPSKELNAHST